MRRATSLSFLLSCLALTCVASPAAAQDYAGHRKLDNRFYLDLGGYWPSVSTDLRVDGPGGVNRSFSLEDDLDFEDRPTLGFALLNLRLGRWRIEAEVFEVDRDKTTVLDREIRVRDRTFPVNATVSSNFDATVYRLSGGFSFIKRPSTELGAVIGLHVTDFDFGIRTADGTIAAAADATAPLPTVGVYGYHAFSPRWLVFGRADLFSIDYQEFSGGLVNLNLGLEYQINKNLGVGFGYRFVKLDLDAEAEGPISGGDWVGNFEHTYSGPTLYLSVGF
jgi:hypothetical protein